MARVKCPCCGEDLVLESAMEADMEHKEEGRPLHKAGEKGAMRADIEKAMNKEEKGER